MNVLDFAIQMERDGQAYYIELAGQTTNKGMKRILEMLADDEVRHREVLEAMKVGRSDLVETTILSDAKNVFASIRESGEEFDFGATLTDLYRKARDIEKKSREFYLEHADRMEGEHEKELFMKLVEEEKRHYYLLDNIIEFLIQPERWLENAEFCHLTEY